MKNAASHLQHLHKESVVKNSFKPLWNKCEATDPYNIAGILCSDAVLKCIKKLIKARFNEKCEDELLLAAVHKIVADKMDPGLIKVFKPARIKVKKEKKAPIDLAAEISPLTLPEI